jgi:hypothetical protein
MTTLRIDPTLRTSATRAGHQPVAHRSPTAATGRTAAEEIDDLPDDYHRALFCRAQAELFRHQWFAGRQQEIDHVRQRAYAHDARFATLTEYQLELIAKMRWSQSAQSKRLSSLEERYSAWAMMYLAFAEFRLRAAYASATPPA